MEVPSSTEIFLFDRFRLDRRGLFRRDEGAALAPVEIGSRALDVLGVLLKRPGDLLSRDDIMVALWPGTVVEEASLAIQISTLRRILDQDRAQGSCIQTVPGRGYRFVAPVARAEPDARPAPRLSIVVLPFTNLSDDREQQYFADGITDDLTTDLSRIPGSFVIARHTAFSYEGKPVDVTQIGREVGVRYVIEGSVRRSGNQVQVNVQLIDAETGAHLWADRFETDRANLTEAQNEITGRLARTLNVEVIEAASSRIEWEGATDPVARDLSMHAWARLLRGPTSAATTQEALRMNERALEIDPESVEAKIGIAATLTGKLSNGWSSSVQQDQARAEQLILEVLDCDPNDPRAHINLGILRRVQNRLGEARIELETAVTLDRSNTVAFRNLGLTLIQMGRPEAAIPCIEKSIRLSPHDPAIGNSYGALGQCHLFLGHLDQAIELLRRASAANPRAFGIHLSLAGALGLRGDIDEARAEIAEAVKLNPEVNSLAAWRASAPWITNPPDWALREKTLNVGLRRAGFPEE
jgi:TolB-like protein/Flp pilus assembly protein TadD